MTNPLRSHHSGVNTTICGIALRILIEKLYMRNLSDPYRGYINILNEIANNDQWNSVSNNLAHAGISTGLALGTLALAPAIPAIYLAASISLLVGAVPYACVKSIRRNLKQPTKQKTFSQDCTKILKLGVQGLKETANVTLLAIIATIFIPIFAINAAICLAIGVPYAVGSQVCSAVAKCFKGSEQTP